MDLPLLIFLCIAGFAGGFVDAVAGGGGLLTIPAYLIAGVPPHMALGTNKFAATMGSFTSASGYARSRMISFKLLRVAVPMTVLGAVLGVSAVLRIPQEFLYPLVTVLILIIGIYSFFKKDLGKTNSFIEITHHKIFLAALTGFILGFYDGFFGPGTGSFLIFIFISYFKFDFVMASGNAKLINFTSNFTSLIMFALNGKINYLIGIPIGICMIIGSFIGTRMAIANGARFIKPIFLIMSFGVVLKLLYDMLG